MPRNPYEFDDYEEWPACQKCGEPADHLVDVEGQLEYYTCDECHQEFMVKLAEAREEFNAMLASGLSREEANVLMIERLHAKEQ